MKILQVAKYPPSSKGGIEKRQLRLVIIFHPQMQVDILCFERAEKKVKLLPIINLLFLRVERFLSLDLRHFL